MTDLMTDSNAEIIDKATKVEQFEEEKQQGTWSAGDAKIALNMNNEECYKDAPVVEIPKEDFDFYMQIFAKYETDKKKRQAVQKRYFENNKKSYYERQKKWRDGHKVDLNAKRRAKYRETRQKLTLMGGIPTTNPDEAVSPAEKEVSQEVLLEV